MNIEKWRRRLVLIATDVHIDGLEHDSEGLNLLKNQEVTIYPIKNSEEFEEKFTLLGGIMPQPGMLLLMSPYDDNTYVELSDARSLIAIEKASLTLRFCSLLGAKSVSVKNIKIVDKEKHQELNLDAEYNIISGSLKAQQAEIENLKNQINVNATFYGGNPDFDKAMRLLKSSRLHSDPFLKNLFEMVKESKETGNQIFELSQEVSLTHSLQKTFNLVASIKFPGGIVNSNYNSVTKEKIDIFLGLIIKF
ncbi:hypothetical protein [Rhodonellum sp.]|uniref:hypothetical protein n=1 Tax=Rhodonellum sp. TaxID=2231180 RepID=UPI002718E6B6|nr:hypothetical protein [Rhodonellum sp.]MDO9552940.1 hypothetical protein [Rhodonellum sp.]